MVASNFISGQQGLARQTSVILWLKLAPDQTGKLIPCQVAWTPLLTREENKRYWVEVIWNLQDPLSKKAYDYLLQYLPWENEGRPLTSKDYIK